MRLIAIVLFQVENDLLDGLRNQLAAPIRLFQRQLLSRRKLELTNGRAESLASLMRHVGQWITRMCLHLISADKLSVIFVLADLIDALRLGHSRRHLCSRRVLQKVDRTFVIVSIIIRESLEQEVVSCCAAQVSAHVLTRQAEVVDIAKVHAAFVALCHVVGNRVTLVRAVHVRVRRGRSRHLFFVLVLHCLLFDCRVLHRLSLVGPHLRLLALRFMTTVVAYIR